MEPEDDMKEVFTQSFGQGVKQTYYETLEGPPPADGASQAPAEGNLDPSSTSETPSCHRLRASSTELSPAASDRSRLRA
jgi:hypothetical protein